MSHTQGQGPGGHRILGRRPGVATYATGCRSMSRDGSMQPVQGDSGSLCVYIFSATSYIHMRLGVCNTANTYNKYNTGRGIGASLHCIGAPHEGGTDQDHICRTYVHAMYVSDWCTCHVWTCM
jgi:hypothetical protein